jgi:TonB-linked SusC/RagA family outer membrane protein
VVVVLAQRTITGKVTDESGNPVANASVMVKETGTGVSTDASGNFSIAVEQKGKTLIFSFVGKGNEEKQIGNQTVINASLKQEGKALDEVVVVAYGQQNRKSITGSVAKLDAKTFENTSFTSVEQVLQGKVAGLQMQSPSGQPGAIQQIRIRGIGSITAGAAPLWVIDGIPVNTGDFSNATNSANTLAGLNPNDIESLTVLKDAAASSIYGARAANGVIVVTTKKGKAGKPTFRLDAEYGTGSLAYWPEIGRPLSKDQLRDLTVEGMKNAGLTQAQIDAQLNTLGYNSTANYNWLDLVTRNAKTTNINGSFSGGDANTQYYFSGGYYTQDAIFIGSNFERYSVNMNLKQKLNSKLSINPSLNISYAQQVGESEGSNFRNPVYDAKLLRPTQQAYNPDGSPNYSIAEFNNLFNPLAITKYDKRRNNTYKILGGLQAEYKILNNLKFSSKLGVDFFNIEEYLNYNPFFGDARTVGGRITTSGVRSSNWIWTNMLDYTFKLLNGDLTGSAKVGYESQKSKRFEMVNGGTGLPLTFDLGLPAVSTPTAVTTDAVDYSFLSQLSTLDFNYKGKYSLSGSFRRDGSSVFGNNNQYANFWSVGAAWNVDRESFLANVKWLSGLKFRASYGVNGNADIGEYLWRDIYNYASASNYVSLPGSAPATVGNPDLTWETNRPFDVGAELGLFDNRIKIEVDYYRRKTTNLLLNVPLSLSSGFATSIQNIGALENKGWEFTLNATPVNGKDFTWDISFNIALNKNKILALNNNADIFTNPYLRRVGLDFQSFMLRQYAGADPATGAPLWYVDDTKNATTTNPTNAARVVVGSATPKGFGSFSTSLRYKGFSLDAQMNYQYGNYIYDQWEANYTDDGLNTIRNKSTKQLRRWQKPGDITDIPKYVYGNASTSNTVSTRYLFKGDFIRLRSLMLTYDVPRTVTSRVGMSGVRFFVKGTNLFTKAFDENLLIDPELTITGLSNNAVPVQRVVSIGVNLNF